MSAICTRKERISRSTASGGINYACSVQSTSPDTGAGTPRTPTAAPTFGRSPQLVTALARLHHDRALTQRDCRRATRCALDAVVALGSDTRAWGMAMAAEIPTLLKNMPSSQATSELCYNFTRDLRARHLQQAAAAHALLSLHGCSQVRSWISREP